MKYVGIKQATSKGYIECEVGGCADFSYPDSKYRRGRVQGGGVFLLPLPEVLVFAELKKYL